MLGRIICSQGMDKVADVKESYDELDKHLCKSRVACGRFFYGRSFAGVIYLE